jgi:hypothetical protein
VFWEVKVNIDQINHLFEMIATYIFLISVIYWRVIWYAEDILSGFVGYLSLNHQIKGLNHQMESFKECYGVYMLYDKFIKFWVHLKEWTNSYRETMLDFFEPLLLQLTKLYTFALGTFWIFSRMLALLFNMLSLLQILP